MTCTKLYNGPIGRRYGGGNLTLCWPVRFILWPRWYGRTPGLLYYIRRDAFGVRVGLSVMCIRRDAFGIRGTSVCTYGAQPDPDAEGVPTYTHDTQSNPDAEGVPTYILLLTWKNSFFVRNLIFGIGVFKQDTGLTTLMRIDLINSLFFFWFLATIRLRR